MHNNTPQGMENATIRGHYVPFGAHCPAEQRAFQGRQKSDLRTGIFCHWNSGYERLDLDLGSHVPSLPRARPGTKTGLCGAEGCVVSNNLDTSSTPPTITLRH